MKETVGIKMHEDCIDCPHRINDQGLGTDWCRRLMNSVQNITYCKLWKIKCSELRLMEDPL